jgi:hypothetical protein
MRSERLCALTKPQSIACLLTLATLLLGFTWSLKRTNTITLWVLYVMVIASVILLPSATPPLGLYLKGLRRAVHEGRRRVHWWHDLAANRVAVVIFAALVGAVSTIGWELIEGRDVSGRVQYAQSIVTGVFLVVGVAFSYQYFLLTFPRRGETYFGLFMFVIWVVPFLAGILIGASTRFDLTAQVVTSLCPWVGMATSAFSPPDQSIHWPRFATLLPAIAVAFVFAILLETRLRRLDWAARSSRRPEPKLLEPVAS